MLLCPSWWKGSEHLLHPDISDTDTMEGFGGCKLGTCLPLFLGRDGQKVLVQSTQHKEALFFLQITDSTLIQLSIHCPRLQVLVSRVTLAVFSSSK